MINIKKFLNYFKLIGIFILIEVLLAFILGFLNLLGISSSFTSIISFISNIIIFISINYKKGKYTNKKGFIEGIINGSTLIIILLFLSIVLFSKSLTIGSFIYYLVLLIVSIISSTIGKNKNIDNKK